MSHHPHAESYEERHPKLETDDIDFRPIFVILVCIAILGVLAVSWILWGPPITAPFLRS